MADTKISAMTAASSITGTELIAIVQSGANKSMTPNLLVGTLAWLNSGPTSLTGAVTITGTTSNTLKYVFNSLGTTQTNGVGEWLANTTAASVGAQQISPSTVWEGQGWKTASIAGSQSVKFAAWVTPIQNITTPTGTWDLYSSINGSAYSKVLSVDFGGAATFANSISVGNTRIISNAINSSSGILQFNSPSVDGNGITLQSGNTAGNVAEIAFGAGSIISQTNSGALDITSVSLTAAGTSPAMTFNGLDGSFGVATFDQTDTWNFRLKMSADASDIGTAIFIDNRSPKRGIEYSATGYVTQTGSLTDKDYVDKHLGGLTFSNSVSTTNRIPIYNGTNYTYKAITTNGQAAAPATTGTMTTTLTDLSSMTITPTGSCTFNASGGISGQRCVFVITTSGTSTFTLTWGTNFKTTATLVTGVVSGKVFTVEFAYDGTNWNEIARTIAM